MDLKGNQRLKKITDFGLKTRKWDEMVKFWPNDLLRAQNMSKVNKNPSAALCELLKLY